MEWYAVTALVLIAVFLTVRLANTPDICQAECTKQGFPSGTGVNMRADESCSSKFGMEYAKNEEYEKVKSPAGFKNVCCCEK